jgi:hypothetical protein
MILTKTDGNERMENRNTIIPIYTSKGEADAFLVYPYIYDRGGEWIGWVSQERNVYSVLGFYVGYLTNDPRILRKRNTSSLMPRLVPPPAPPKINLPATIPLAPMMSELKFSVMDVLMEEPQLLHTADLGELKDDVD